MRPRRLADGALLAAATLAAYANAFRGTFQFDDWNVIAGDPRVASLAAWWASMPGIRPLLKLTYALNNGSGLGLAGFHAFNLAVHLVNVLLVRALLERLGRDRRVALLGAALFALHPVQTEAVTYVSGRSASFSALFALGAVLGWMDRRRGLASLLFALGVAVKETVAVLPLALLLVDRVEGRPFRWREWIGPAAVLAAAAVLALASPDYTYLLRQGLEARPPGTQLLTQAHAVVYLLGLLVRPDRLNADPMLPVIETWSVATLLPVLVLGAALAGGLLLLRRRPAIAFGILWVVVWLLPTHSLIPRLDPANDRQWYLALAGPAWLLAWSLRRRLDRRTVQVGAAVLLAALGAGVHLRNRVYADEIAFWRDVASRSPHNGRAWNNLGYAHVLRKETGEAEAAFRRAIALDPEDPRAAINLHLLLSSADPPPAPAPPAPPGTARGSTRR